MVLPWNASTPLREGLSGSLFYDRQHRIILQSRLNKRLLLSDQIIIQV